MHNIKNLLSPGNTPFYQFSDSNDRTWLIPERNMAMSMNLYHPKGLWEVIFKESFPTFHKIPFADKAFRAVRNKYSLNPEVLAVVQETFGVDNIEFSILGGEPSAPHRITIQFFKGKKILGYGKVTDNHNIRSLFVKEHIMLDYLKRQGVTGTPESLLLSQLKNGSTLSLQTSEKSAGSFSPEIWTTQHEDFINDMTIRAAVPVSFLESDFYRHMTELTKHLRHLPSEHRPLISDAMNKVHDKFGVDNYLFSVFHGDFEPRNMFINNGKLFVTNWEYAELTFPPTLDRYHFLMRQYIQVEHIPTKEAFGKLREYGWFDADLFRCYLLEMIYRSVCNRNNELSESTKDIAVWSRFLFYLTRL